MSTQNMRTERSEDQTMNNELRASLVNQLIEAGGRVFYEGNTGAEGSCMADGFTSVWPGDFGRGTFYLLEDGETPREVPTATVTKEKDQ